MFCSKCGSKIEENTSFCPYCGNKISESKKDKDVEKKENDNEKSEVEVLNEEKNIETTNSTEEKNVTNNFEQSSSTNSEESSYNNHNTYNNSYNQNPPVNLITDVKQESYEDLNKKSLIFGILGFFIFPCAIVAICLGSSYKKKTNNTSSGFILGIISCVLNLILILVLTVVIILAVMYGSNTSSSGDGDNSGLKDYYENGSNINYQTIGNDDYGYLTVSKDWTFYSSSSNESTLQYIYGNTSNILTMYAMKNSGYTVAQYADSIKSRIQSYGADNVSYEIVNVGNYKAVKQQAYLSSLSSYMTTWCFQDENGALHYIAINADSSTEFQDIVNTYKLTR